MTCKVFGVFGASGFGREVMPVARGMDDLEGFDFVFVDDNPPAAEINGYKVLTYQEFVDVNADVKSIIVAIADAGIRRNIEARCANDDIKLCTVVSEKSLKMDQVKIGDGAVICPFVTLTSNIKIGKSFHANIYSYVAHDCVIGDYVTFAPAVKCNGNVKIENNAYIGTGAIIKQGKPGKPLIIGEGAVVGMGAVVTKNVPAGAVVVGNPAKPLGHKRLGG
ncbi:GDP-perosamine N-acetyltransferase [Marinobacterium maritimum]|uniref:GDP-perosamine N-acetyltransferase n=1 Tax=Marinobacterium maritimum TaxID=500162 RepID=A0ABN1I684_9GAMM